MISFEKSVIANITQSVTETVAANPNVHMILCTIPDIGVTPSYEAADPSATQRAADTKVVEAINAQIIALATKEGFPVVDMFSFSNQITSQTTFAGVSMKDIGGDVGNDMFLSDNFHPGTVLQGLLANAILLADSEAYGDSVLPLSDQTIAENAGLTPKGISPTYYNVAPEVIYTNPNTAVPEPSTLVLAAFGIICIGEHVPGVEIAKSPFDSRRLFIPRLQNEFVDDHSVGSLIVIVIGGALQRSLSNIYNICIHTHPLE